MAEWIGAYWYDCSNPYGDFGTSVPAPTPPGRICAWVDWYGDEDNFCLTYYSPVYVEPDEVPSWTKVDLGGSIYTPEYFNSGYYYFKPGDAEGEVPYARVLTITGDVYGPPAPPGPNPPSC